MWETIWLIYSDPFAVLAKGSQEMLEGSRKCIEEDSPQKFLSQRKQKTMSQKQSVVDNLKSNLENNWHLIDSVNTEQLAAEK